MNKTLNEIKNPLQDIIPFESSFKVHLAEWKVLREWETTGQMIIQISRMCSLADGCYAVDTDRT